MPAGPSLLLLGGAALLDGDGRPITGRATQRHRIALLARLALAPPGGITRDKLIGLLWPERDESAARHLLRTALHELRQTLGPAALPGASADVRLDARYLLVDVHRFETLLAAGDLAGAVAVYHGPFLDGFFLEGSEGFEEWANAERVRLAAAHADALERLAEAAVARGEPVEAARQWRALAAVAPDDARVARRAMEALAAAGDAAGALALAAAHEQRLRQTFGVAPDRAIGKLAERLRREAAATGAPLPSEPTAPAPAANPSVADRARPAATAPSRVPRSRGRLVAATIALGAVLAAGTVSALRARDPAPATDVDVMAVLPFAYEGAPALAYLGDGLPRLLGSNLNGAGELRTIDPTAVQRVVAAADSAPDDRTLRAVADRFGAGLVVSGEVIEAGGRVRIVADVVRADSIGNPSARRQVVVERRADSVFALVDELTTRLVAAWGEGRGRRLTGLAARTTPSLPALRAYLDGERAYAAGRYAEAVTSFERATREDSLFALAWYRLSVARPWTALPQAGDAAAHALRLVGRLSQRDSLLVEARAANAFSDPVRAISLYQRVLTDHPDDVEAWLQLGEVQYHWGPLLGDASAAAEAAFARALALDPTNVPAATHLARLAAADGRAARLDSLRRRLDALAPGTDESAEAGVLAASLAGRRVADALPRDARDALRLRVARTLATTGDVGGALALVAPIDGPGRAPELQAAARLLVATLEATRGRHDASRAALRRLAERRPAHAAQYAAALALAAPPGSMSPDALAQIRAALERAPADTTAPPELLHAFDPPDGLIPARRAYLLACLAVALRDDAGAGAAIAAFRAAPGRVVGDTSAAGSRAVVEGAAVERAAADLTRRVRAAALARDGQTAEALTVLGAPRAPLAPWLPTAAQGASADERWLRARLLDAAGQGEAALRLLETFPDPSGYDLPYLVPALRLRAEILARQGEDRAAATLRHRAAAVGGASR